MFTFLDRLLGLFIVFLSRQQMCWIEMHERKERVNARPGRHLFLHSQVLNFSLEGARSFSPVRDTMRTI